MLAFLFVAVLFIFSVIIHEVSHGLMANYLGDPTAKMMGRLTLNPLPHIDLFGSIILPLLLFLPALLGIGPAIIFGWAKPVPYDPRYLKNPRRDAALIGAAGPASNLLIALFFGTLLRFIDFGPVLGNLLGIIVWVNLLLGVFNLVPIHPLDGSRVLMAFLSDRFYKFSLFMERYGLVVLLAFIFFGAQFLTPVIYLLFRLFTGAGITF